MIPKYMRAKDIAEYGGIGVSTVHKWVKEEKLPQAHKKLTPKCTVWLSDEVIKAFDELGELATRDNRIQVGKEREEQSAVV